MHLETDESLEHGKTHKSLYDILLKCLARMRFSFISEERYHGVISQSKKDSYA